jgi:pyridine nucleotide-disulfide oxidoreductase family protein
MNKSMHLVLLGAGHAHIYLLKHLIRMASLAQTPKLKISLVSPHAKTYYSGMVPGLVAGHYSFDECAINVDDLIKNTNIQWHVCHATGLDLTSKQVFLENGPSIDFDIISIDTGAGLDASVLDQVLPGASVHSVQLRPLEKLAQTWPQIDYFLSSSQPTSNKKPVAVIGGGAAGFEIACSLAYRFPQVQINLFSGSQGLGHSYNPSVSQAMQEQAQQLGIQIFKQKVHEVQANQLLVSDPLNPHQYTAIASEMSWLAIGSMAPTWLKQSGLQLDEKGFIAVNEFQQSVSHDFVFAAGDVASRIDKSHPRSGVYAVRAGPALARNIILFLNQQALQPHLLPATTLNLLSCGWRYAIASYGRYSFKGVWVWYLKNYIDKKFMKKYQGHATLDN